MNNVRFLILWIAQLASGLGNTMAVFIISWLVFDITGSEASMGIVWFFYMSAFIISLVLIGPFIDKVQKKYIMVLSEWGRSISFLLLVGFIATDQLSIIIMYIIVILVGLLEPIFKPASRAYLSEIVEKDQLLKANSILESTLQITMIIGPSFGGLLLLTFSPLILLIFLISFLAIAGSLIILLKPLNLQNDSSSNSWLIDFKIGLKYFKDNPLFLYMVIFVFFLNFSAGAIQPLLLPYVINHLQGEPEQYGFLTSSLAFGMLVGALFLTFKKKHRNLKYLMFGSIILSGICLSLLGYTTYFVISLISILLYGFFLSIFNINNTTLYQVNPPIHLRGRVMSVRSLVSKAGIPIGALIGGYISEGVGVNNLFIILGLTMIFTCIVGWVLPVFNTLKTSSYKL
ncbi:MFS transporter [Salipaludibacillus sp. LMS25]|uniref:MFS transporter n=1 Tax=Salipaludibacillus sp. LMS25 TaxID=2924031 RepID=UPI0020D033F2|nr:MFS transporter [Salipaludibacillus sp. LMS25]UTR15946.1 MFS transporter [Salipaludibacillus sp. LMS25]